MLDLSSPDSYLDGPPHAYFAQLRATDPVHWQPTGSSGYWAILKHTDVELIARAPTLFSSAVGGVVLGGVQEVQSLKLAVDGNPLDLDGLVLDEGAAELDQARADLELDLGKSLFAARQLGQVVAFQIAVERRVQLLVRLGLQIDESRL